MAHQNASQAEAAARASGDPRRFPTSTPCLIQPDYSSMPCAESERLPPPVDLLANRKGFTLAGKDPVSTSTSVGVSLELSLRDNDRAVGSDCTKKAKAMGEDAFDKAVMEAAAPALKKLSTARSEAADAGKRCTLAKAKIDEVLAKKRIEEADAQPGFPQRIIKLEADAEALRAELMNAEKEATIARGVLVKTLAEAKEAVTSAVQTGILARRADVGKRWAEAAEKVLDVAGPQLFALAVANEAWGWASRTPSAKSYIEKLLAE
jgi:hypothetical protein